VCFVVQSRFVLIGAIRGAPSFSLCTLCSLWLKSTMKNEIIRIGQIGIRFLLDAADTGGSVAMLEFTVPVGAKVPLPHYHKQ